MPITKPLRETKYVEDFDELISTESTPVNPSHEFLEDSEFSVELNVKQDTPTETQKDSFFSFLKDQVFRQYLYKTK